MMITSVCVCGGGIAKNKDGSPILVSQWMTFSESYSHHKMLSERESETAERGKKKKKVQTPCETESKNMRIYSVCECQ